MPIKRYMPSLESIKEEYAREVNRKFRAKKRGPRPPSRIPENSVPWIENPKTVAEFWTIAQMVQGVVDKWGPKAST